MHATYDDLSRGHPGSVIKLELRHKAGLNFRPARIDALRFNPSPIVTTVSPKTEFFPAEQYHQDFMNSNPTYPYIAINDMPKVNDLKRLFPELYRDQPVLMLADGH